MQRIAFDTEDVDPTQRVAYWLDKIEAFFDVDRMSEAAPDVGFSGQLNLLQCGETVFGEVHSQGQLYTRRHTRLSRDGLDHFIVQVFLEGGGPIEGGGVVRPGDLLIIDMGKPHVRDSWGHRTLSFVIPRDKDPSLTRLLDRMHERILPASHPLVILIVSQMRNLWDLQADMTQAQMGLAMDSTMSLFASAMTGDGGFASEEPLTPSSPALSAAIRSHIEDHLARPLSSDELCARFRVSRAHLYRLFAEEGGVMRYIQGRRLQRAYRALVQSGPGASVMAVAANSGFKSESHFARSFRAEFGRTPTDVRHDAALRARPTQGDRFLVDTWLRNL